MNTKKKQVQEKKGGAQDKKQGLQKQQVQQISKKKTGREKAPKSGRRGSGTDDSIKVRGKLGTNESIIKLRRGSEDSIILARRGSLELKRKDDKDIEEFEHQINQTLTEVNALLRKMAEVSQRQADELDDQVSRLNSLAMDEYGQDNFTLVWQQGYSPYEVRERIQIETAAMAAKLNKEKARLVILKTDYKEQVRKLRNGTVSTDQEKQLI